MIECKNNNTWALLKKDYDDFILILVLSFLIVFYLQKSLTKALFKSFVVLGCFLIIEMSCYHIGYLKGVCISLIIGMQLDHIYRIVCYYIIEWLYNSKEKIKKILETVEIDNDTKDNPNKTNK